MSICDGTARSRTEMVIAALRMAIQNAHGNVRNVLFHSDRGVQFTPEQFRECLNIADIKQSMSGKGDCWDNAPCESFFGKLKTEWIYPDKEVYATFDEAKIDLFRYIEGFYNTGRIHQSLGWRTPVQAECEALDKRIAIR